MRFALLLLASSALAQPFVSNEIGTAVLERSPVATRVAPAMSLVRDGSGFVAAWSAGSSPSRIYAARLDASFTPLAVVKLDSYHGEAYDASYPDIAPIDGGYAVVWLESERISAPRATYAIAARLTPAFVPQPPIEVGPAADTALVRVAGGNAGALSVLVQGFVYTIDANGARSLAKFSDFFAVEDAVVDGAPIGVTAVDFNPGQRTCCTVPLCGGTCFVSPPRWTLGAQIERSTFSTSFGSEVAGSAIGFGGDVYLVTWLSDLGKPAGLVNAVRIRALQQIDKFDSALNLGSFVTDGTVRPSVGWDGERFLIAWRSGHDIAGAALTPDGQVQRFTLVATPESEANPLVLGVSPSHFVLAYEVQVDAQHRRLAWRYVDFKQRSRPRPSR